MNAASVATAVNNKDTPANPLAILFRQIQQLAIRLEAIRNEMHERFSMVLFVHAAPEGDVSPLPHLIQRVGTQRYAAAIQRDLELDATKMGVVMGCWYWGYALLQVPAGWLGDRWGSRRALVLYCLLWSILTGMVGLAGDWRMLSSQASFATPVTPAFQVSFRTSTSAVPSGPDRTSLCQPPPPAATRKAGTRK